MGVGEIDSLTNGTNGTRERKPSRVWGVVHPHLNLQGVSGLLFISYLIQ